MISWQVPVASSLTGRSTVQAVLVWCQVKLACLPENIFGITNIPNIIRILVTDQWSGARLNMVSITV